MYEVRNDDRIRGNIAGHEKREKARILFSVRAESVEPIASFSGFGSWGLAVCLVRELIGKTGRVKEGMQCVEVVMIAFFFFSLSLKRLFDSGMFNNLDSAFSACHGLNGILELTEP